MCIYKHLTYLKQSSQPLHCCVVVRQTESAERRTVDWGRWRSDENDCGAPGRCWCYLKVAVGGYREDDPFWWDDLNEDSELDTLLLALLSLGPLFASRFFTLSSWQSP